MEEIDFLQLPSRLEMPLYFQLQVRRRAEVISQDAKSFLENLGKHVQAMQVRYSFDFLF